MDSPVIIIGSGAAGLSAALELAKNNISCFLVSDTSSERSESVMAEGGMNAALDTANDSPARHAEDTYVAGRSIADRYAVEAMCAAAPDIIRELLDYGACFTLDGDSPALRAFGGQSRRRTVFAGTSTGKHIMTAFILQARRYEDAGLIKRLTGWRFLRLIKDDGFARGCIICPAFGGAAVSMPGSVIIASGGMNGLFGNTTGSAANTAYVTASLFADGIPIVNGEFIQYHPTTVPIQGKNLLISEAVRGEGARLFVYRDGSPYYFMEDKYPERGNLMPRDVISREEWAMKCQGRQVYLDMRGLDSKLCAERLNGVLRECREILGIDPFNEPIPVTPGIHYFMGGVRVDRMHRASLRGLYAAGECAGIYHGANRLGGNSLTGALYGGIIAARSAADDLCTLPKKSPSRLPEFAEHTSDFGDFSGCTRNLQCIMSSALGLARNEAALLTALEQLEDLAKRTESFDSCAELYENLGLRDSVLLGKALVSAALARKESRGAHFRSDFPTESVEFQKQSRAEYINGKVYISFEEAGT